MTLRPETTKARHHGPIIAHLIHGEDWAAERPKAPLNARMIPARTTLSSERTATDSSMADALESL